MKVVPKTAKILVSNGKDLERSQIPLWGYVLLQLYQSFRTEDGKDLPKELTIFNGHGSILRFLAKDLETNAMVGMATIIIRTDGLGTSYIGVVEDVYVLPQHRGHGYCTQLVQAIVGYSKKIGLVRLELTSNVHKPGRVNAMRIYEKLGFVFEDPYDGGTNHYRLEL